MESIDRESKSLYELYQSLHLPVDQFDSTEGFTIFNLKDIGFALPYQSAVYRPNFFSFLFVKNGKGKYVINGQTFEAQPHSIYFTNPSNDRTFSWEAIEEIYLVTFDETFLKKYIGKEIFEDFPFLLTETVQPRVVPDPFYNDMENLYLNIEREYRAPQSPIKYKVLGHLLAVLLLKIKDFFWQDYNPIYEGNRSSQIVIQFKRQLEHHYRNLSAGRVDTVFRIQDYANLQNLHPNYLSNVIKIKTGKPIATWIAEKTIAEAKSLLMNASVPVKEISYKLGFSEVAHFSNYFKKHTNLSPSKFRQQHNL